MAEKKLEMLVTFELPHYDIRVSPAFQADINAAKAALDARQAAQQRSAQRARGGIGPKAAPHPPFGGAGGAHSAEPGRAYAPWAHNVTPHGASLPPKHPAKAQSP